MDILPPSVANAARAVSRYRRWRRKRRRRPRIKRSCRKCKDWKLLYHLQRRRRRCSCLHQWQLQSRSHRRPQQYPLKSNLKLSNNNPFRCLLPFRNQHSLHLPHLRRRQPHRNLNVQSAHRLTFRSKVSFLFTALSYPFSPHVPGPLGGPRLGLRLVTGQLLFSCLHVILAFIRFAIFRSVQLTYSLRSLYSHKTRNNVFL
ncbi:hypothetical protein CPC08DRAFT_504586 [Agrocybe pediades]|nr:hypothetical protein CPC08DRAFT_504586 [Agrocybe pediades]